MSSMMEKMGFEKSSITLLSADIGFKILIVWIFPTIKWFNPVDSIWDSGGGFVL
jgi:hypothetical protein